MAEYVLEPNVWTFNGFIERKHSHSIKRWDAASQTCLEWNSLRRDPDLWFQGGTCFVHLYAKGDTNRGGPSFRIPFSTLVSAQCYPLIDRFLVAQGSRPRTLKDLERWGRLASKRQIDLYIPAPYADIADAFQYHLAIRNLFAWVYGRPLVGEHLGGAFVALLHSMDEFRSGDVNNDEDLMAYLVAQGYANFVCQPDHALAMLHLAESFQMRELYIRTFCHCVGMSDLLYTSTEYQHTKRTTKKLIRKARNEMGSRLYQASDVLRNFLDEELSETYLGLSSGARAHLEYFRSFLLSFYTNQLGYYPPRQFDPDLYRAMREDFEALYELLVDEGGQDVSGGGICTLQLVRSFDDRCRYRTLDNPQPLIPQIAKSRKSWLSRDGKMRHDDRLAAHAALVRASNWRGHLFQNELVRAYKKFEELSLGLPVKVDRRERVSVADARRVRWILIYTVYQVLRSVTEEPPEVRDDTQVPYHLAVNTRGLPPWDGRVRDERRGRKAKPSPDIEIKPDVDYFALTHGEGIRPAPVARPRSCSRDLSRRSFRNSIRLFRSVTPSPTSPSYHEIMVHGYGNGTSPVQLADESVRRNSMTSAKTPSLNGTVSTIDSVHVLPEPEPVSRGPKPRPVSMWTRARARSIDSRDQPTVHHELLEPEKSKGHAESGRRDSLIADLKRIRRMGNRSVPPTPSRWDDEWDAMEAFMEQAKHASQVPAWEQYAELGGLRELR